jgi:hypothetical protein
MNPRLHRTTATAREHLLALPGDEMIRHAAGSLTHAITVVGAVFPALPGRRDGFVLLENEPTHWLVLGWPAPDGDLMVTWTFALHDIDDNTTRLIVRARASDDYRFHGLPKSMGLLFARLVHFVMERKQLLEIARRAERHVNQRADHGHQAES